MMSLELKCKMLTLAAEGRIIHEEERRLRRQRQRMRGLWYGRRTDRALRSHVLDEPRMKNLPSFFADQIQRCERRAEGYAQVPEEEKEQRRVDHVSRLASLRHHRVHVVRREARATHLARAFMKGLPYKRVEFECRTKPDWAAVERIVLRFHGTPDNLQKLKQGFAEWIEGFTGVIEKKKT